MIITPVVLAACGGTGGHGAAATTITLYNGQHPQLTQALVTAFEKKTGISVRIRSDDGIILADEILQEGGHSPADVYLTENSPELRLLAEHRLLATLPSSVTSQVPARYSSPGGYWAGIATRVSALAYNPSLVSRTALPSSVLDLAKPAWKGKVAIAPTDSDFVPLVGAVLSRYGHATALSWLKGLKANSAVYGDDESVAAAVNRGQSAVGVINQYYWYRLRQQLGSGGTHSAVYYFPGGDVGGIQNISGVAVLASSAHPAAAERFAAFLVSAQAQRILAAGNDFEYPARPGIAPNPALPPLSSVHPATISVVGLGDDRAAAALLRQAGLT